MLTKLLAIIILLLAPMAWGLLVALLGPKLLPRRYRKAQP